MITMNRQLLSGTPEDIRRTMEDLACEQDDHEYLNGARFRELAVQLATRDRLAVSAVTSDDGAVYKDTVWLAARWSGRTSDCCGQRKHSSSVRYARGVRSRPASRSRGVMEAGLVTWSCLRAVT
jgi:hypothetical protein